MRFRIRKPASSRATRTAVTAAVLFGLVVILMPVACQEKPKGLEAHSITAAVSIEPEAYFAGRLGGLKVAVYVMVPTGQSPATYEPTPKQMAELEEADVYFRIGVPFENRFIGKIESIVGADKVVDLRTGITLRAIGSHAHEGDTTAEVHGGGDPHIWLDPMLVKTQARTMVDAFEKIVPQVTDRFEKNLTRFQRELDSVDAVITELLAPHRGKAIYVYHPSYGYFTDRYGLRQVAVEDDGREPSARRLSELIDRARADGVTTLFVQPQFARKPAEAIAHAIGAEVVELDPLAADYLNNLTLMARRISLALTNRNMSRP